MIIIARCLQSIQIFIIISIKLIYGIYTLIYKPKEFEVRNSPLNQFAVHLSKVLYCVKMGCLVSGGAAATIAGGASFDSVLESAGREKIFVPMMGSLYKYVFGELPKIAEDRIANMVKSTEATPDVSVSDMLKKYQNLNSNEKLDFLAEIIRELEKK